MECRGRSYGLALGDGHDEPSFATTRSGLPSPFTSPIATERGSVPVA